MKVACEVCGARMIRTPSEVRRGEHFFCKGCRGAWIRAHHIKNTAIKMNKINNPDKLLKKRKRKIRTFFGF